MTGDNLPTILSFHPHVCGSVPAIELLAFSLNFDHAAKASDSRIAMGENLDVFFVVGSAEAAECFQQESRLAASFAHPNVVTVYDFGVVAERRAFLVMELLHGRTLREELKQQKRLAAPRALEILRGVCAAVDTAHRRRLIPEISSQRTFFWRKTRPGRLRRCLTKREFLLRPAKISPGYSI